MWELLWCFKRTTPVWSVCLYRELDAICAPTNRMFALGSCSFVVLYLAGTYHGRRYLRKQDEFAITTWNGQNTLSFPDADSSKGPPCKGVSLRELCQENKIVKAFVCMEHVSRELVGSLLFLSMPGFRCISRCKGDQFCSTRFRETQEKEAHNLLSFKI